MHSYYKMRPLRTICDKMCSCLFSLTCSSTSLLHSQVPGSVNSLVGFVGVVNVGILMHPKRHG